MRLRSCGPRQMTQRLRSLRSLRGARLAERAAGQVFVGMVDPDPRNNGKGLHMLRQAGVSVEVGILQEEVEQFLAPYLAKPS